MTQEKSIIFVLGCVENTEWHVPIYSYPYKITCTDYAEQKWCENGGIGSGWGHSWTWMIGNNGHDARSVCCVCGGVGDTGNLCDESK